MTKRMKMKLLDYTLISLLAGTPVSKCWLWLQ